jgi:hypothetical protein
MVDVRKFFSRAQRPDDVSNWTAQHVWSWLVEQEFALVLNQADWHRVSGFVLLGLNQTNVEVLVDDRRAGGERQKKMLVATLSAAVAALQRDHGVFLAFIMSFATASRASAYYAIVSLLCRTSSAGISRGGWCGPGEFRCCSGRCDLGSVWS